MRLACYVAPPPLNLFGGRLVNSDAKHATNAYRWQRPIVYDRERGRLQVNLTGMILGLTAGLLLLKAIGISLSWWIIPVPIWIGFVVFAGLVGWALFSFVEAYTRGTTVEIFLNGRPVKSFRREAAEGQYAAPNGPFFGVELGRSDLNPVGSLEA